MHSLTKPNDVNVLMSLIMVVSNLQTFTSDNLPTWSLFQNNFFCQVMSNSKEKQEASCGKLTLSEVLTFATSWS
jgi:hypothetical protein